MNVQCTLLTLECQNEALTTLIFVVSENILFSEIYARGGGGFPPNPRFKKKVQYSSVLKKEGRGGEGRGGEEGGEGRGGEGREGRGGEGRGGEGRERGGEGRGGEGREGRGGEGRGGFHAFTKSPLALGLKYV